MLSRVHARADRLVGLSRGARCHIRAGAERAPMGIARYLGRVAAAALRRLQGARRERALRGLDQLAVLHSRRRISRAAARSRRERRARRRRDELARDEQPRRRAHGLSALAARGAGVRRRALRAAFRCRGAIAVRHAARDGRAPRVAHEGRRRRRRTGLRRLAERRSALDGVEHRDRRRRRRAGVHGRASPRSSSATSRRQTPGASRWTRRAGSSGRTATRSCAGNRPRVSGSE